MAPFLGDQSPFSTQSAAGSVKTLFIEAWPSIPAPKNTIMLEMWRWDDYRWSDALLWGDPERAERLYLRAYQTAKSRMAEIDVVMEQLLEGVEQDGQFFTSCDGGKRRASAASETVQGEHLG